MLKCCIDKECTSEPADLWFTIEIVCSEDELQFCPAHALAAEVLASIGFGAEVIRDRLRALEDARRVTPPALHRCRLHRDTGPQGAY